MQYTGIFFGFCKGETNKFTAKVSKGENPEWLKTMQEKKGITYYRYNALL